MKLTWCWVALCALTMLQPAFSADHEGKKVFDKTCKNCHGPEGTGNSAVDKVYKIRIPRLNSELVQSYTDAQLKGIIMGGKGKMQPVRQGGPAAPHSKKLTGDQIEHVVAYVRTLNQD